MGDSYFDEHNARQAGDNEKGGMVDDEQSPIEEVALVVSTADDPSLPIYTFRMWFIGVLTCALLSFINQYFWFRQASLIINPIAAIICTLYLGRFMADVLPTARINMFGTYFTLNDGPFGLKEHVLISIFANTGSAFGNGNAYAIDIITIVRQMYGKKIGFFPAFLLITTTQVLGYGWAGLLRRFLVDPAHMWWPLNLVNVSLFRTLHEPDTPPKGQLTRLQFFLICVCISFSWYAVPDYLMPIVTTMSWVCWAWPHSVTAHQLGSGQYGMGIGAFSMDWATISAFLLSPLATPWFALVNIFVGFCIVTYIFIPAIYWGDVYDAKRYAFLSSKLFLYSGKVYPTQKVLTPQLRLNVTAYEELGKAHLSGFFAITYGIGFAALTATVVHVALWHGVEIWQRSRLAAMESKPDIHTRLMQRYPKLPEWWFMVLLVVNIGVAIGTLEGYKEFQLPWWGLLIGCALSAFFTLPIGIIAATTNQVPGLNIITEMIWGYIQPGRPVANVCFKTYGYISMTQAVSFLQDFKLGHYMKIPPRSMFLVQVCGTILAGIVNLGAAYWLYGTIEKGHICITSGPNAIPLNSQWTCPSANVFFTASVIWGLIGPKRVFGPHAEYRDLNWFFLIGAFAPIPFWALAKVLPNQRWLRKVNMPILIGSTGLMPPAGPINYTSWFVVGMTFNYFVFKYKKAWWVRYNYVLSAAMDTGVMFMAIVVFVSVQVNNGYYLEWWGAGLSLIDNCKYARCARAKGALSIDASCPVV